MSARRRLVLAVDVGSSALKAALYDEGLRLHRAVSVTYPLSRPRPGWLEVAPGRWWRAFLIACRRLLDGTDIAGKVAGIAFSTLYPAVFPVDERLRPLRSAILYCDVRGAGLGEEFERRFGRRRLMRRTGLRAHPGTPALSTLLWLARNEPDLLRRSRCLLQPNSYLVARLTGRTAMDYSTASLTGLLDQPGRRWWPELVRAAGLRMELLPELVSSHQVVGGLSRGAADALGLTEGLPVMPGGGDSACAALAAGVLRPGCGAIACGFTDTIVACLDHPLLPEGLINACHVVPDRYLAQATVNSAGAALDWALKTFFGWSRVRVGRMEKVLAEAERTPPGAGGLLFLPYLQGERTPRWDPSARGLLAGLSLKTDRGEILRSVLEGVALSLRQNLVAVEDKVGCRLSPIILAGGGARGMVVNRIRADVLGRTLHLPVLPSGDRRGGGGGEVESAASSLAGAALLGVVGLGLQTSFSAAVAALREVAHTLLVRPRRSRQPVYDHLFEVFRQAYPALRPTFLRTDKFQ